MRYRFKLLHTINDVCPPFNTKVVLIYGDQETRIKLAWQKRKHCKVQHLICTLQCFLFCQTNYRPQRSWAKVIFSQVCVKNSVHRGGGCLPQCMLGYTPQEQTPPGSRHPPGADTPLGADTPREQTPPRADTHPQEQTHPLSRHLPLEQTPPPGADPPRSRHPSPPGSRLQHTVNEWPVRILLECILV